MYLHTEMSYLAPELWLAQTLFEPNLIVALDQADTKGRRYEVFNGPLVPLENIFAIDNGFNMLGYGRISSFSNSLDRTISRRRSTRRRTNAILIHQRDKVRFGEKIRFARMAFPELADRRLKLFAFLEIGYLMPSPFIVWIYEQVILRQYYQTWIDQSG